MGISSAACWKKTAAPDMGSMLDVAVTGVVCAAMASCSAFSRSMSDNSVGIGGAFGGFLSTGDGSVGRVSDAVFSAACSSAFAFALLTFALADAINSSNPA